LSIPFDPIAEIPKIVAEGPEHAGANLIRMFVRVWDSPLGGAAAAMIRSAMSNEWTTRLLREFITTQILRKVIAELKLDPAEAPLRVSLIASQLAGLAMMRYIIKLEPLASLPVDDLIKAIGPNVQRYITGSLDAAA
jgi:hypothetical protein